jgi:DNA-directed RNA polymerase subunit H
MVNTNAIVLLTQIFNSRKIILELMNDRGYDVTGYSNFNVNEVNAMKNSNQLDMLLETTPLANGEKPTTGNKVYIRYCLTKAIRPANLHEMIDDLFVLTETLKKNDTLYIIIKDNVNDTLVNELKDIWERYGIFIIVENIKYLQFNILKHVLVPTHKVMNESDIERIMMQYNIVDRTQFPDISRFDPVARAICLRPGELCHIIRSSKTAITTNYYRMCM